MNEISKKARIAATAIIHDHVIIEDDVIIHDYVVIYPHTHIKKGCEIFDHCVLGKIPVSPGVTSRKIKETLETLIIGESCVFCPSCVIYAGTIIGHHNLFGDFCSIREECIIGNECLISRNVSVNYNTKIGNNTKILDNSHITGNMQIGNHVFISALVVTTNDNTMGREEYNINHVGGPIIKDDVTIGAAANILPNVTIEQNAVVGAGSVVTKNVDEDCVVMGVPARFIKKVGE